MKVSLLLLILFLSIYGEKAKIYTFSKKITMVNKSPDPQEELQKMVFYVNESGDYSAIETGKEMLLIYGKEDNLMIMEKHKRAVIVPNHDDILKQEMGNHPIKSVSLTKTDNKKDIAGFPCIEYRARANGKVLGLWFGKVPFSFNGILQKVLLKLNPNMPDLNDEYGTLMEIRAINSDDKKIITVDSIEDLDMKIDLSDYKIRDMSNMKYPSTKKSN